MHFNCPEATPRLIRRACGGWLAVAPLGAALQIGLIGGSEAEAEEQFHATWRRCNELLANDARASIAEK
jgi:hypothetical protein